MRFSNHLLAVLPVLALTGCGEGFPPPSEVSGIRVLAVRSDPGSGVPGETMHLEMLVADTRAVDPSSGEKPAAPKVWWLAGCHNPPGRQYFACLPAIREAALALTNGSASPSDTSLIQTGTETSFDVALPPEILSAAPLVAHDPIHYGVSYVFFAVCAGELTIAPEVTNGLPVACTSGGKPVGASGFVPGFTTIYTYDDGGVPNQAPILTWLDFDGEHMPATFATRAAPMCMTDEDCELGGPYRHRRKCLLQDTPEGEPTKPGTCAPVIGKCSGESCPAYKVVPQIDTASVEQFTGGNEIMWASFYASSGAVSSPTRLLVDREAGITSDFSEEWHPPDSSHTARIWVTVNDQRGGADWAFFDVSVE